MKKNNSFLLILLLWSGVENLMLSLEFCSVIRVRHHITTMNTEFIPFSPRESIRKCTLCNRELDIESFRASNERKLLKRCRPCNGDKRVLDSPQKAVSPPSKRSRNHMSPTKASLGRSVNREFPPSTDCTWQV